jgi:TetR/AcrR family transcriptional regulator, cholesterol catabolism regulator
MLINVHSLTDQYHSTVIMMRDQYQHWLEALVEDAQRVGALRADIPARYQTLAILNLLNWTIFWYDPHGPISPEQLASWLRDIAFNGVGTGDRGPTDGQPPRSATTASMSSQTTGVH